MTYLGPRRTHHELGAVSQVYADSEPELRAFVRRAGLPGDIDGSGIVPHLLIADANRKWTLDHGAIPHTAWQFLMWIRTMDTATTHHPISDMADFPPILSKLDYATIRLLSRESGHTLTRAPAAMDAETRRSRSRPNHSVEAAQYCELCEGCDGNLPTHCPGTPLSPARREAIYEGLIDFRDGRWLPLPTVHMAQIHGFKELTEDA